MTIVCRGYTRKGVVVVLHLRSFCMWLIGVLLDPQRKGAGKRQGVGNRFSHGWGFKTLPVKSSNHHRNQYHGKVQSHTPNMGYLDL